MRLLIVALALAAGTLSHPYSIWCDYHSTYAYFTKTEYPNGKQYCVYAHGTGINKHEIRQACD